MRPIANFTLHAMIAAALAAFAATAAAAGRPVIDNEGYVYLPGKLLGRASASQGERLDIQALGWGTAEDSANLGSWTKVDGLDVNWDVAEGRVNKVDGFTIKQKTVDGSGTNQMTMDDTAGREKLQPGGGSAGGGAGQWYRPGNTKYSTVKMSRAAPSQRPAANETITIGSNRTESGLPTGKRQHKPFTLTRPAAKGSVWIRLSSPWGGCRAGERYPSLELGSGGKAYLLQDAVVAGCAGTGTMVALDYAGVAVRGWDPKKKEPITGQAQPR